MLRDVRTYGITVYTDVLGIMRTHVTTADVQRFLNDASRRILRKRPVVFDVLVLTPDVGIRGIEVHCVYENPPTIKKKVREWGDVKSDLHS